MSMQDIDPAELERVSKDVKRSAPKRIPIEDILELRNKQLNGRQIAQLLGCSEVTISRRLKAYTPIFARLDRFKKHRADLLTLKQADILRSITDKDIREASLLQRATTLGILHDKERLERGLSTSNVDIHSEIRSSIERVEAIRALIAEGGGERGGDGGGNE